MAPYNYFFYTLFEELEVEFNNELVMNQRTAHFIFFILIIFQIDSTKFNYQLQTYLKLLTNTTEPQRSSILSNAGFSHDKAGTRLNEGYKIVLTH